MKKSMVLFVVFWSLGLPCVRPGGGPITVANAARLVLQQPARGSDMPAALQRTIPRKTGPPSQVMFDDFIYSKHREMTKHGWIIRSIAGWPGVPGATWWTEGVSFLKDPDERGNRILRMISSTSGT